MTEGCLGPESVPSLLEISTNLIGYPGVQTVTVIISTYGLNLGNLEDLGKENICLAVDLL